MDIKIPKVTLIMNFLNNYLIGETKIEYYIKRTSNIKVYRAHSHEKRFYYKNLGMIQFYHPQNYKESSTKVKNHPSNK